MMYLFPPVILWSPLEQFRTSLQIDLECPKCLSSGRNNVSLHPTGWRDGVHGERSEPRKVYGTDGVTLLIGRVYSCAMKHEVVGYHLGILEQLPKCFIPFRLWHITGFTDEFISMIVSLITAGMSIGQIRCMLQKQQNSLYYTRQRQFEEVRATLHGKTTQFPNLDAWKTCFASFIPSGHGLSGCFLADFWTKECVYTKCMQTMTIGDDEPWLSLDHTFSSASVYIRIYWFWCDCLLYSCGKPWFTHASTVVST